MKPPAAALATIAAALLCSSTPGEPRDAPGAPLKYTSDGQLNRPEHYREWVFLTSGFDMSYAAGTQVDHHMFDNVFVNPDAYRVFMASGSWPDQTVLVIEIRGAEDRGSIKRAATSKAPKWWGSRSTSKMRRASPESGRSSNSQTAAPSKSCRSPMPVIPVTPNMAPWIRRSCSSIRHCCRSPAAKAPYRRTRDPSHRNYPLEAAKCWAGSAAPCGQRRRARIPTQA